MLLALDGSNESQGRVQFRTATLVGPVGEGYALPANYCGNERQAMEGDMVGGRGDGGANCQHRFCSFFWYATSRCSFYRGFWAVAHSKLGWSWFELLYRDRVKGTRKYVGQFDLSTVGEMLRGGWSSDLTDVGFDHCEDLCRDWSAVNERAPLSSQRCGSKSKKA